ncbi:TetR/AcrR family transcriptional regulator [Kitasatospora sp. NPDC048365]|uniref:TetR/AcrR family transcriptional regulator n=1 Tax=Kitasatospora sp. NPDC048365 TaxID=3364050 RepID=UPI00371E49A8
MPRTSAGGNTTRDRLLRAGAHQFAAKGVHGAQLRDVVKLAGQSNPSAVQYHFGSRDGLLDAVLRERQERTDRALAERMPQPEGRALGELVAAVVDAEATELRTGRGRDGLRIAAQVSHRSGLRTREPHPHLADGGRQRLITELEVSLADLPAPVRLERIDLALTLVGTALAERARRLASDEELLTDEALFLADLAAMAEAMLTAPVPRTAPAASGRP